MKKLFVSVFLLVNLIYAELPQNTSKSNPIRKSYKTGIQSKQESGEKLSEKLPPMFREMERLKEIEIILSSRIGQISDENKMIKIPPMQKELERQKKINEILTDRIINFWLQ